MTILTQKEIDFDTVRQPVPHWVYTRQQVPLNTAGRTIGTNFVFEVEYGRAFFIQNIYCIFDNKDGNGINIKITDATNSREILINPAPVSLLGTPGGSNKTVQTVPNPYTDDLTGITYPKEFNTEKVISTSKYIGYMEPYRGNVTLNFRNANKTLNEIKPEAICDFVVFGYLVTQENLEMWSK